MSAGSGSDFGSQSMPFASTPGSRFGSAHGAAHGAGIPSGLQKPAYTCQFLQMVRLRLNRSIYRRYE
jgi:hypothetical protein